MALAPFLGVHLVQAGYTTIDNPAWILSGLFDVAGPVLAGAAVGYVSDRGAHLQRLRQATAGRGRGDRGPPW